MTEYKSYLPELDPCDDDMIAPEVLEEMGIDTSIFNWLKEDLDAETFNNLKPTQIVFGMIENEHAVDKEFAKPRPFVCLYKTDDKCMIGFQITTETSSPLCKYPLKDWTNYGLRIQSYVNIDHTVLVRRDQIKFTNAKNLSADDTVGLIEFMRALAAYNKQTGFEAKYDILAEAERLEKVTGSSTDSAE